jgi:hypothetical protein
MQITLKNIKHSNFASHETECFEATVYIDGKRAGTASNDGQGGPNMYHPNTLAEALERHAETLPPTEYDSGGETITFKQDADIVIGELLMQHLLAQDLKRAMSRRILFLSSGGELKETKSLPKDTLNKALMRPEHHLKNLDYFKILNLLPFAEALSIYRAKAGA